MSDTWIAVTSDRIEFVNMRFGNASNGRIIYTPQENAVVKVDGAEYPLEKGAKFIVTVVGNTVHIPTEVE